MRLMPILYVRDMDAAVAFFTGLGFELDVASRSHGWTELRDPHGALLALHTASDGRAGTLELSIDADHPLERLLETAPVRRGISDEAFGRSLVLDGPDGCAIQVNENDRELYA